MSKRNTTPDAFDAAISSFKKHAQTARGELSRMQDCRTCLVEERAALLKEPLSREDYAQLVLLDIDHFADQYTAHMQEQFCNRAGGYTSPMEPAVFGVVQSLLHPPARYGRREKSLGAPLDPTTDMLVGHRDELRIDVVLWLFRDQIKAATKKAILAIEDWPQESTVSYAHMCRRLAEIDTEVAALNTSIEYLDGMFARVADGA